MMLFDVETFKNTYPGWFEPTSIEGIIFITILFCLFLLVLGLCVKYFGSKLIPTARIDIFNRIVRIDNRELDAEERKNLAVELRNKMPHLNPADDVFATDIEENRFKKSYTDINLKFYGYNEYAKEEYILREGYRYMPLKEIYHVIDLIS